MAKPMLIHGKDPRPIRGIPADRDKIDPNLRRRMRECMEGQRPWPLVILGPTGVGKTSAACAMVNRISKLRIYAELPEILDELTEARNGTLWKGSRKLTQRAWWHRWKEAEVTVLDDLREQTNVSDWVLDVVKRSIDNRRGKACVVVSNLNLEQIQASYDDRIASRLAQGTVVWVKGKDRRLEDDV